MAEPIIRQNISSFTTEQVEALRVALRQLKAVGSYSELAALHLTQCQHNNPLFLPWHREYIARLEQQLRALDPSLHLPFWDWVNDSHIPPTFADETYLDATGQPQLNPLFQGELDGRVTTRKQQVLGAELGLRLGVKQALLEARNYVEFNRWIAGPHDHVHFGIGNDFVTKAAAYDPLFWAHHANVDRYWAAWQKLHPAADASLEGIKTQTLPGFDQRRVEQVLNHQEDLGYDYDYTGVPLPPPAVPALHPLAAIIATPHPLADIPAAPPRWRLRFSGLRADGPSFIVYVFLNQPEADLQTQRLNNPHYAGAFSIFGMGADVPMVPSDLHHHSHAPSPDHAHPHHAPHQTAERILDLSEMEPALFSTAQPITVHLVAQWADGVPLSADQISLQGYVLEQF